VNYAEARECAWQERLAQKAQLGQNSKDGLTWVVGGSLILADIYYNGAGVKRDVPLVMRFACESEEMMAGLALGDIAKHGATAARRPFEFCDYAATTFTENFCAAYLSDVEDDRRRKYYESLKASMSGEQRTAFEKLLAAETAFIEAHAGEVYQGGSIRVVRSIGSQKILEDLFRGELANLERKKWPAMSASQITGMDALLQVDYKKAVVRLESRPKDEMNEEVTVPELASAEKAWEGYRDAWVAFARVRYPAQVEAIWAEITLRRCEWLRTM
jgi:hypothetical protein